MSSLTPNLSLVKPAISDVVSDTIPALAGNFDTIDSKFGNPSNLTTTDKSSMVNAVNEVKGGVTANASSITTNANAIGTLSSLTTTAKNNLVAAVNEITQYPVLGVYRQSAINGGFAVNQRAVSGTVTLAAGQYGHDRWKAGASGCTYTFSTVNNVTTITITAGSLAQVIEGNDLASGIYILSWSGTAQGKIGAGSYGASGISASVTGGSNLSIEFNTGTLSKVQFNYGNVALPFQPRSFQEELEKCQRYYEKSYDYSAVPGTAGTGLTGIAFTAASTAPINTIHFKTRKRIQPTITLYSPFSGASGKARDSTAAVDITATINNAAELHFGIIYGTTTVGNGISQHYAADAEL